MSSDLNTEWLKDHSVAKRMFEFRVTTYTKYFLSMDKLKKIQMKLYK